MFLPTALEYLVKGMLVSYALVIIFLLYQLYKAIKEK
jgi:hypothetical protein